MDYRDQAAEHPTNLIAGESEQTTPEVSRAARAAWARLIKKVYEVDPMRCRHCGAEMRILAVIEEAAVFARMLRHLGIRDPKPPSPGVTRMAGTQASGDP